MTSLSIQDIYKIRNKRIKTYRKIWECLYNIAKEYKLNNKKFEEYKISDLYHEYNIDPRTANKYFWEFFVKIWNKKFFIIWNSEIDLINEIIISYKKYTWLNKKQYKMSKYIIYFLLQFNKWVK